MARPVRTRDIVDGRHKRIRTPAEVQKRAQELRREATLPEQMLWACLRNRQLGGLKFRRQHPLGPFIVDFCCPDRRLIVELDGGIHREQADYDQARTERFEDYGYRVIRSRNEEVIHCLPDVLRAIEQACADATPLSQGWERGRGEGRRSPPARAQGVAHDQ